MPKFFNIVTLFKKFQVHFVDYGNEEEVRIDELREISDELPDVKTTPALVSSSYNLFT